MITEPDSLHGFIVSRGANPINKVPGRILNGALLSNGTGDTRRALEMHDRLQNTVIDEWSIASDVYRIVVRRSGWNKRAPSVGES